jgi:hypothetical protein
MVAKLSNCVILGNPQVLFFCCSESWLKEQRAEQVGSASVAAAVGAPRRRRTFPHYGLHRLAPARLLASFGPGGEPRVRLVGVSAAP